MEKLLESKDFIIIALQLTATALGLFMFFRLETHLEENLFKNKDISPFSDEKLPEMKNSAKASEFSNQDSSTRSM